MIAQAVKEYSLSDIPTLRDIEKLQREYFLDIPDILPSKTEHKWSSGRAITTLSIRLKKLTDDLLNYIEKNDSRFVGQTTLDMVKQIRAGEKILQYLRNKTNKI